MKKQAVNFDEQLFEYFLTSTQMNVFTLSYKDGQYGTSTTIGKVYSDHFNYVLLMNFSYIGTRETSLRSLSLGSKAEVIGVYFPESHSLVFSSTFYFGSIRERCKKLKFYAKEELGIQIYEEINLEFHSRRNTLIEKYKHYTKEIAESFTDCYNHAFTLACRREKFTPSYISSSLFERSRNLQTLQTYLEDPKTYVKEYADAHYASEEGEASIKGIIIRFIAMEKQFKELDKDPLVLKSRILYELLKEGDLKDAKKIWVTNYQKKRTQVNNFFQIHDSNPYLGDYSSRQPVTDIVSLEYSRKVYPISL